MFLCLATSIVVLHNKVFGYLIKAQTLFQCNAQNKIKIMNFFARRKQWSEARRKIEDDVFALSWLTAGGLLAQIIVGLLMAVHPGLWMALVVLTVFNVIVFGNYSAACQQLKQIKQDEKPLSHME